jgi:hypothetical protein
MEETMMKKLSVGLLLVCGFVPAGAFFFDDFEGDALGPWWRITTQNSRFQYNVRDGWLNVEWINGRVYLYADIPTLGDYEMTTRVSWDSVFATVGVGLASNNREDEVPNLYSMAYSYGFPYSWISARQSIHWLSYFRIPRTGTHQFKVRRAGAEVFFYFDDVLFHTQTEAITDPADKVGIWFHGGSNAYNMKIDYIRVVPEPLSLTSLGLLSLLALRRRRH